MTSNYQLLEQMHEILQPRGYLEIGVRHGDSLRLAKCPTIGIDPVPNNLGPTRENENMYGTTSDDFFAGEAALTYYRRGGGAESFLLDLAYIDGMHLVEYALRDFINIEKYANERTIVVFDDVLPYSAAIATREQPAGDWTGDVWKVIPLLELVRPDLSLTLVDVAPTGALVVTGLDPRNTRLSDFFEHTAGPHVQMIEGVPQWILNRVGAEDPDEFLRQLRNEFGA